MKLKSDVEATLALKVTEQRRALETELSRLGRYQRVKKSSAGRSVAPKYRNPEIPLETWAGRGLKPHWLAAAIKSGAAACRAICEIGVVVPLIALKAAACSSRAAITIWQGTLSIPRIAADVGDTGRR
jgi:hypothetical protein